LGEKGKLPIFKPKFGVPKIEFSQLGVATPKLGVPNFGVRALKFGVLKLNGAKRRAGEEVE